MVDRPPPYVVVTLGSTGDAYPLMSLAQALQRRGRKVTVMGSGYHEGLMREAGLAFVSVGSADDYLRIIANPALWKAQTAFAALFDNWRVLLAQGFEAYAAVAGDEPAIVIAHPLALPGMAVARDTGLRMTIVAAYLAPSNIRSCEDPLYCGPLRVPRWVPRAWRRALWRIIDKALVDPVALTELNAVRTSLGLAPAASFLPELARVPDLSVTLFPPWFAPSCSDWPAPLLEGGFPLFDPSARAPLSAELAAFLAAGAAPIVFTPGTGHAHARRFFEQAVTAATRLGRRAILATSHRQQLPADLPPTVLWQSYVSFAALLPRAAALVHHGGIGTTAEALRAGTPQLVVPFAWDQFDNGARITSLGVGRSLPATRLTARRLQRQLALLLSSDALRSRCASVAARFSAADDVAAGLCDRIEAWLAAGPNPRQVGQAAE